MEYLDIDLRHIVLKRDIAYALVTTNNDFGQTTLLYATH